VWWCSVPVAALLLSQVLPKVLPLETLKTFHELGVEPPSTNEDVPKTIAALEAKKKEFEEKRDKAAVEPPSEEPEAEEAAEEPAAEGDKEAEAGKEAEANGDAPKAEAEGAEADADDEEGDAEAKISPKKVSSPTKGKVADGEHHTQCTACHGQRGVPCLGMRP